MRELLKIFWEERQVLRRAMAGILLLLALGSFIACVGYVGAIEWASGEAMPQTLIERAAVAVILMSTFGAGAVLLGE